MPDWIESKLLGLTFRWRLRHLPPLRACGIALRWLRMKHVSEPEDRFVMELKAACTEGISVAASAPTEEKQA